MFMGAEAGIGLMSEPLNPICIEFPGLLLGLLFHRGFEVFV
jgi:hypothetical protein